MYLTSTWENLLITSVFHKKKCIRKQRFKQKSDFLIKSHVFNLLPNTFAENLQPRWHPGRHLAPLNIQYSNFVMLEIYLVIIFVEI